MIIFSTVILHFLLQYTAWTYQLNFKQKKITETKKVDKTNTSKFARFLLFDTRIISETSIWTFLKKLTDFSGFPGFSGFPKNWPILDFWSLIHKNILMKSWPKFSRFPVFSWWPGFYKGTSSCRERDVCIFWSFWD